MPALFIAVLALIAYGSLYPWHFAAEQLSGNPFVVLFTSWPHAMDRFVIRDVFVNIALYVPAGFTGHLAFRRWGKSWVSFAVPVLICAVHSGSIEMIQLWVPPRDCSLLDLADNIAGAVLGVILAVAMEEVLVRRLELARPKHPPDRAALALLLCFVISVLFPLFPVLGRAMLMQKARIFLHQPPLDLLTLLSAAVVWFAVGCLCQKASLHPARRYAALAVLLVPAQLFIVDRQPVPAALLGAISGTAAFALLWRKAVAGAALRKRAFALVFLATIAVRGLAPFQFESVAGAFHWIPLAGFLNMDWQVAFQVLAEKLFWYGAAVWLFMAAGLRPRAATAFVTTVLFAIEMAQTYQPGRVAEITDPLLCVFAAFSLAMLARRHPSPF